MLISELYFPHLAADREERLSRELERERVVRERLAEAEECRTGPGAGQLGRSSDRLPDSTPPVKRSGSFRPLTQCP